VLAGLAYAAIWALAPLVHAAEVASAAVAAAMVSVIGYCLLTRARPAKP